MTDDGAGRRTAVHGSERRSRVTALFGVDIRSLALFRAAAAVMLLVDLFQRARWIPENYGRQGLVPAGELAKLGETFFPSVHLLDGSVAFQSALLLLAATFAVLLLVGRWTRLAAVGSWYLLASLHVRNPTILDAGDYLLAILLFWSVFLPLGATWSLDARRRPWRGPQVVLSPASAALLLQFAVLYLVAGLAKTGPEWRSDGTAILYVMNQSYWSTPLGQLLAGHPELMRLLTFAAVVFEVGAPFLLFSPRATARVRCLMIPAFWVFQHSLGLTIQLGVFPWICSVAILPFVPGELWDRLAPRVKSTADGGAPAARPGVPEAGGAVLSTLRRIGSLALLFLVVLVLYSNVAVLDTRLVPRLFVPLITVPRLEQRWAVYAPGPGRFDYGFTREGALAGGSTVDLDLRVRGERWARVLALHGDYRFKMFVQVLNDKELPRLRNRYGRWLCREWNAEARGGDRLEALRLRLEAREILPEGGRGPLRVTVLLDRSCPPPDRAADRVEQRPSRRVSAEAPEVGGALLGEGAVALLGLGRVGERVEAGEGELALAEDMVAVGVEGGLQEADGGG